MTFGHTCKLSMTPRCTTRPCMLL